MSRFLLFFLLLSGCMPEFSPPKERVFHVKDWRKTETAEISSEAFDKEAVLRMDKEKIRDVFGVPALIWREGNAEVWQYGFSDCVVNLFFYQKKSPKPIFLEVYEQEEKRANETSCLLSPTRGNP